MIFEKKKYWQIFFYLNLDGKLLDSPLYDLIYCLNQSPSLYRRKPNICDEQERYFQIIGKWCAGNVKIGI